MQGGHVLLRVVAHALETLLVLRPLLGQRGPPCRLRLRAILLRRRRAPANECELLRLLRRDVLRASPACSSPHAFPSTFTSSCSRAASAARRPSCSRKSASSLGGCGERLEFCRPRLHLDELRGGLLRFDSLARVSRCSSKEGASQGGASPAQPTIGRDSRSPWSPK